MTRNKKILIGVVLVLLAAMCIWTVQSVPDRVKDAPPLEKRVMTYNGNTIVEEKDGRKLWELTAESMEVDIDTQDAAIVNLDARFYTEDGRTIHRIKPGIQIDNSRIQGELQGKGKVPDGRGRHQW